MFSYSKSLLEQLERVYLETPIYGLEQKLLTETQCYFKDLVRQLENANHQSNNIKVDVEPINREAEKIYKYIKESFENNLPRNEIVKIIYKEVKRCVVKQQRYVEDILNDKIDDIIFLNNQLIEDANKLEKLYNYKQQEDALKKVPMVVKVLTLESAINLL
ncbi:MAG: hypothetical protein ATN35_02665 [Epulopiscium sp. Nele67-Bin004]|nr:MAG: hypothetical protein ATN35_02665 [Epulopiscium sp. Nele67-Bin004]